MKALAVAIAALLLAAHAAGHAEAVAAHSDTGSAPDGTQWALKVPSPWNGTLLIYSHGGAPARKEAMQFAPRGSDEVLLAHGYALGTTAYRSAGWNPAANALSQFAALPAIKAALPHRPLHVVNVGTSYGGLVGAIEVDRTKGDIDGSVLTCGLIVGGIDLFDAQLDGIHAVNQLLTTRHDIRLVDLGNPTVARTSGSALTAAVAAAQSTPQGRARLALVAALMHVPTWHDGSDPAAGDMDAKASQQVAWLLKGMGYGGGLFGFMQGSRLDAESQAGGNPSSNDGVDYTVLLAHNEFRPIVQDMYRKARLSLTADLRLLSKSAAIKSDPAALAWMRQSSVPSSRLAVPVLAMQTSGDPVAPHSFLVAYAERAKAHASGALLREAMVDRPGHCAFQASEILTAVDTIAERLSMGRWPRTNAVALQTEAGPGAAFVKLPTGSFATH